jgi:pimeloyl-ACP methyl ester carboxylesterase
MCAVQSDDAVLLQGHRIHVREIGSGPPVLLINGLGAHTAMWGPLEQALEGFRIVSFDAPGTGESATSLKPVSVRRLARIATGVLDHFEIDQADVLGYSMGGIVLQQLCADAPSRVRRAVLVATSPGVGGFHGNALAMLNVLTPIRYLSPRLYSMTIGSLAGGRARNDPGWVARHGALRLKYRPTMAGYIGQLMSLTGWSGLPLLEHIGQPVLVVTGDSDPLNPVVNSMLLAHLIPRARLLMAPGEGHLMLMDTDSIILEPIRRFLEAEDVERSDVWNELSTVAAEDLAPALGKTSRQLQPYGLLSARKRRRWLE